MSTVLPPPETGAQINAGDGSLAANTPATAATLKTTATPAEREEPFSPIPPSAAGLKLSGSVISAICYLPYQATVEPDGSWNIQRRKGSSEQYDSFCYLNSPRSGWKHTLVGWPGEIRVGTDDPPSGPPSPLSTAKKNTAAKLGYPDTFTLSASQRRALAADVSSKMGGTVKPVWLSTDPHSDDILFIKDSDEKKLAIRNQLRWRVYAEQTLYPLFHYRQPADTAVNASRHAWADYVRLNRAFASKIVEAYRPGDIVVVHDYHLMLVPQMVRQRLPHAYIGFYLHVPFPSSEFYRCLSRRKETLEGVLGANMVGFQSYGYSRHFSSCCTRILGYEASPVGVDARGAHVAIDVFPAGIDVDGLVAEAFSPAMDEKVDRLRSVFAGKKVIVGRDRLESVRGVTQKLEAFEMFLDRYPEWRDKVVLVQITSSVHADVAAAVSKTEEDVRYLHKLSDIITRINGEFGSVSSTPVRHYTQYIPRAEYFALLRVADVALITSVRDGMNTTALEYVMCQKDNRGGLILSEFSGTASSLGAANHQNPWDLAGVARAVKETLEEDEQSRRARHDQLIEYVTVNNVYSWTDRYLKRLVKNLASFDQAAVTPVLDSNALLAQYRRAGQRLFLFDYDGTLTPIVKDPQAAIPSDKVIRTIKTLAADPRNAVWIISGRDQQFLDEWMGHISELGFSAEHGSFLRYPGQVDWISLAGQADMGWQERAEEVFQRYTERTQGSFIERKKIALTWHYRRADPEYGAFQAKACFDELVATVRDRWEVEIMAGKANLEVRPRFLNKGEIVTQLIQYYSDQAGSPPELVLCFGDDTTDEDMFRALLNSPLPRNQLFSCTVGASSKQTLAGYHLVDPHDVISAIGALNSSSKPR